MLRRFFVAALLLLCALCALPGRADTYRVIIYPANATPIAVNDYGDFTLLVPTNAEAGDPTPCGISEVFCFLTYYNASGTYRFSLTEPTLAVDPTPEAGPGCPSGPLPLGFREFCDNGHALFGYNDLVRGVFSGFDLATDEITSGSLDGQPLLTASGNALYIDGLDNSVVEIIDTSFAPAPEPTSFTLLGTGLLGVAGVVRRRLT